MYPSRTGSWRTPSVVLVALATFGLGASVVLVGVPAFALGVYAERSGLVSGTSASPPADVGNTFDPFWETWNLVREHYVDRNAVDPKRMTVGAIDGMLASLGDDGHTTYLTAEQYDQMLAE